MNLQYPIFFEDASQYFTALGFSAPLRGVLQPFGKSPLKPGDVVIHVLRYTDELEQAGFTKEQTKKSVQVWMDLMDQSFATKADFKEHYFMSKADLKEVQNEMHSLKSELRAEMKDLRSELQTEMKDLRGELQTELKDLRGELQTELKDVRVELKRLEQKLTIRLGAMLVSSVLVLAAIITLK